MTINGHYWSKVIQLFPCYCHVKKVESCLIVVILALEDQEEQHLMIVWTSIYLTANKYVELVRLTGIILDKLPYLFIFELLWLAAVCSCKVKVGILRTSSYLLIPWALILQLLTVSSNPLDVPKGITCTTPTYCWLNLAMKVTLRYASRDTW